MKNKEYYIEQILAKCNSNLDAMKYWANKGAVHRVEILAAQTETLIETLDIVFSYKDTEKIKNKIIDCISIATENDYHSNFSFL